jgi:hypothetical protein
LERISRPTRWQSFHPTRSSRAPPQAGQQVPRQPGRRSRRCGKVWRSLNDRQKTWNDMVGDRASTMKSSHCLAEGSGNSPNGTNSSLRFDGCGAWVTITGTQWNVSLQRVVARRPFAETGSGTANVSARKSRKRVSGLQLPQLAFPNIAVPDRLESPRVCFRQTRS